MAFGDGSVVDVTNDGGKRPRDTACHGLGIPLDRRWTGVACDERLGAAVT